MAAYSRLARRLAGQPGQAGRPALVLLHGFTQTSRSWAPLVERLGQRHSLVLPDAPGHGGSASVRADLWATADLLAGTLAELVAGPAGWVGYSMGGRMALHVALAHPDKVGRLVLISTTAGMEGPADRKARRASDEALALRIEEGGREGLGEFLGEWLAQPLFATLPASAAGLEARMANTPAGLASSLRLAGTGAQVPLWERLGELGERALPVLVVAGALDTKYCEHARRMASAIGPGAQLLIVEGAGHACHLEKPAQVAAAIADFCAWPGPGKA
ncbi:MAG: alpha/beta fold hydrolase [Acidimicrobiales bacterium]